MANMGRQPLEFFTCLNNHACFSDPHQPVLFAARGQGGAGGVAARPAAVSGAGGRLRAPARPALLQRHLRQRARQRGQEVGA